MMHGIHSKTMIWTAAVMAAVVFAAAPAAEAFVYPMVAVPVLAAVIGTGAFVADQIIEANEAKEPRRAERENPQAEAPAMAAESAGQEAPTD